MHYAILKAMQKQMKDSAKALQLVVNDPDYNPQHGLFLKGRKKPSKDKLVEHMRILDYNIKTGFLDPYFTEQGK